MFDKSKFEGIVPALLTPFDENGAVNHDALRRLVEYNLEKGVKGFYVNGSTAEVFLLSDEERRAVYRTVAEVAKGKATLIAQIGAIATAQAIEYARYAESLGYDAISAVAPFYFKFSFAQIKKHYYDIVSSVNLPMIIYNIPTFTGVSLTVDQVGEFFCDERFIGM
ncbi:MAG: dihydrodipicolinate synthase family protein, partial [Clostridia bacterium]|nr:dihydrodipicolinate synthase family protein [Clostridia bacterium]